MENPEEAFSWQPKSKPRSSRRGEAPRTPGLPKENATRSATLLQELSECRRKAYLRLKKNPERLGPSPFAREKFADGREFEKRVVESGKTQKLLQEAFHLREPVELLDLKPVGETLSPATRSKLHQAQLAEVVTKNKPVLVFQIQIMETGGEENLRGGIADLALWTGTEWVLGEIKATTHPKTSAALQLYHYLEIWKSWAPEGTKTSGQIFVVHCREGWQFECGNARREKDCIRYSTITTFRIAFAASAYQKAWEELQALETHTAEPAAEFCIHCTECPHRLTCYKHFATEAESPEGLSPAFAGFDEAETLWLKECGIQTNAQAIEALDSLEELHGNNPQIKKELRRRLTQASILGGISTWAPPSGKHNLLFYSRSPEKEPSRRWKAEGQPPQEEIPACPKGTLLIAFSRSEMQAGLARIRFEQGKIEDIKAICLQEELEAETLFPYENLSLRGMLGTLEGVLDCESWVAHARKNLIPWLEATLANPSEEYHNRRERILEVEALWTAINEIHKFLPPH